MQHRRSAKDTAPSPIKERIVPDRKYKLAWNMCLSGVCQTVKNTAHTQPNRMDKCVAQKTATHKTMFENYHDGNGIICYRIRVATPRYNSKVERRHRIDGVRFTAECGCTIWKMGPNKLQDTIGFQTVFRSAVWITKVRKKFWTTIWRWCEPRQWVDWMNNLIFTNEIVPENQDVRNNFLCQVDDNILYDLDLDAYNRDVYIFCYQYLINNKSDFIE